MSDEKKATESRQDQPQEGLTVGDMFDAIGSFLETMSRRSSNPYEGRKVFRDEANGLEVSTCWTTDEGYETALLDVSHAYPVERYPDKKSAIEGHVRWLAFARSNKCRITMLDGLCGVVPEKEITLERKKERGS